MYPGGIVRAYVINMLTCYKPLIRNTRMCYSETGYLMDNFVLCCQKEELYMGLLLNQKKANCTSQTETATRVS